MTNNPKLGVQEKKQRLLQLLVSVEGEMKSVHLWGEKEPSIEAYKSTLPFFYDTMAFEQWLQWVYIPRFRDMITQGLPLPSGSDVAPMAEECFKENLQSCIGLINAIREFDIALKEL